MPGTCRHMSKFWRRVRVRLLPQSRSEAVAAESERMLLPQRQEKDL